MYSIYKMKIFVFDVDNTLILHTNQNIDFYKKFIIIKTMKQIASDYVEFFKCI